MADEDRADDLLDRRLGEGKEPNDLLGGRAKLPGQNLLRDEIKKGDRVLFYHSACKEPAVVGTAIVSKSGYPDPFAFDSKSKYFDKKSDPEDPTWYMVDIKLEKRFDKSVTLKELRERAGLKEMMLLQKGSRLSVQPVRKKEFETILKMAKR